MRKTKKLRVLREIYASIPAVECKGLCADQCTTIPVFPFELEQLEAASGRKLDAPPIGDVLGGLLLGGEIGMPCPLLLLGRCSVYEHRPLICRAFGAAESLRCPHGCRPAELVSNEQQYDAFETISAL